eukprot:g2461.t1
MGKKKKDFGEHSKKTEARERKAQNKRTEEQRKAKEDEDTFWRQSGEGALSKAQTKRRDLEKQRNEAQVKKQEARLLLKEEEESLGKPSRRQREKLPAPKVTQHRLLMDKETEKAAAEAAAVEQKKLDKREVDEDSYAKLVEVENVNREEKLVEARNIDDAIVVLNEHLPASSETQKQDLHPEKRRKAAYKTFYERELAELKEEKPGLKLSQYKDLIFKRWLKSPDNPMNQVTD